MTVEQFSIRKLTAAHRVGTAQGLIRCEKAAHDRKLDCSPNRKFLQAEAIRESSTTTWSRCWTGRLPRWIGRMAYRYGAFSLPDWNPHTSFSGVLPHPLRPASYAPTMVGSQSLFRQAVIIKPAAGTQTHQRCLYTV